MLSGQQLFVTDKFGLRNEGFHSAPGSEEAEALPVPATLLINKSGEVVWMDLSADYQRRSDPSVVLAAMEAHFDIAGN